jgi:hypothetical protein
VLSKRVLQLILGHVSGNAGFLRTPVEILARRPAA